MRSQKCDNTNIVVEDTVREKKEAQLLIFFFGLESGSFKAVVGAEELFSRRRRGRS